ncbi:zinc finger protein 318 [Rhinophrynus dorsalis]
MYRTPKRRQLSPDPEPLSRDSSSSRSQRSWSRGRSPARPHRSPARSRRSRSRGRSRSRSRSSSRGRPRPKGRSRSRGRSPTRPHRSLSRGRRSDSRSGRRLSPFPRRRSPSPGPYYSRPRSPSHYTYRPDPDLHRYSPSYRSKSGRVSELRKPPDEPLPMPKKSILKKRVEPEIGSEPPPQQTENNSLSKEINPLGRFLSSSASSQYSPQVLPSQLDIGVGPSLAGNVMSAAPADGMSKRTHVTSMPPASFLGNTSNPILTVATGNNLTQFLPASLTNVSPVGNQVANAQIGDKVDASHPIEAVKGNQYSQMGNFLQMFNKSACEAQGIPYNPTKRFPEPKATENQQTAETPSSSLLLHDQVKADKAKPTPTTEKVLDMGKPLEIKKRSISEIEDEERFLYGDEEVKKPTTEPPKVPQSEDPCKPPLKSAPNTQEFEKIHDLLKTIGLDIGVSEISKLAVRTQERLHGKKAIPDTPQKEPQKTASEAPQKIFPQVPQKAPQQLPQKGPQQAPQKGPQQAPPQVPQKAPLQVPQKAPLQLPQKQVPQKAPLQVPQKAPLQVPQKAPLQVPQKAPLQVPKHTPELGQADSVDKQSSSSATEKKEQAPLPSSARQEPVAMPILAITDPTPPMVPSKVEIPVQQPLASPQLEATPPVSPSQIPIYPPSQMVPGYSMPPTLPSHNYNPYSPYVSYSGSSWPVYNQVHQPPPTHVPHPPLTHMPVLPPNIVSTITRSNLRVIETSDVSEVKAKTEGPVSTTSSPAVHSPQAQSKLDAKETEKVKVKEELEVLRNEQMTRKQSLKTLSAKVEQLRIQQGMLLRKKQREKDGHKHPLLEELNTVLNSAQKQIRTLKNELEDADHKQNQLIKVGEILGINPEELAVKSSTAESSRKQKSVSPSKPAVSSKGSNSESRSTSNSKTKVGLKATRNATDKAGAIDSGSSKSTLDTKSKNDSRSDREVKRRHFTDSPSRTEKRERDSKRRSTPPKSSSDSRRDSEPKDSCSLGSLEKSKSRGEKSRSKSPRPSEQSSKSSEVIEEEVSIDLSQLFEYYETGNYWCEECKSIHTTLNDFLLHFHNKKHNQAEIHATRPWAKKTASEIGPNKKQKVSVPLKGEEFVFPINGFYCKLCDELLGDHVSAEGHLKTYAHNDNYKKYVYVNPSYERKRKELKKEVERKQEVERKRKLEELALEALEEAKSKRLKKEEEVRQKEKPVSSSAVVCTKADIKQNAKQGKEEPVKTPTFGKFTWKGPEGKTPSPTAAASSKDESAVTTREKEKEDDSKGNAAKQKGIEIKLLGKNPHGNSWNSSSSGSKFTTSPPTTSTTSPSSFSQTKVRPNLPVPVAVLRKSSAAPINKPAPLNTFLSIKSSKTTSKPLPVLNSKSDVLPQEVVSKAFGGQQVVLKETHETPKKQEKNENHHAHESTLRKSAETPSNQTSEVKKSPLPQNAKEVQKPKDRTHDLSDLLHSNNENRSRTKYGSATPEIGGIKQNDAKSDQKKEDNQASKPNKETPVLAHQSGPALKPNEKTPSGPAQKASPALKPNERTPTVPAQMGNSVSNPHEKTLASPAQIVNPALKPNQNITSGPAQVANPSLKPFEKTPSGPAPKPSAGSKDQVGALSSSKNASPQLPSRKYYGLEPHSVPAASPVESKYNIDRKSDNEGSKGVIITDKHSSKSSQESHGKGTSATKPLDTKSSASSSPSSTATSTSQTKSTPSASFQKPAPAKPVSNYINTAKLNQKFKSQPLSLPTSLFGHMPDIARKDIIITSMVAQKSSTNKVKESDPKPEETAAQKPPTTESNTKTSTNDLQQELDSYYKLIATEDDPEDVTTSEDQDVVMEAPVVISAPDQIKVEIPEKTIVPECPQPTTIKLPEKPPVPNPLAEDLDDSDMACEEAPEAPIGPCPSPSLPSTFSGPASLSSSHDTQMRPVSSDKYSPFSPEVDSPTDNYSMEDLALLTTCDSD